MAVNTEIYIKECLQPRLLPFIYKHLSDLNFQFVHDLAGAHFSIETIANMKENFDNIAILLNIPPARPKENLWDILAPKIY